MDAKQIVKVLLESDPDEIDPKQYLNQVDLILKPIQANRPLFVVYDLKGNRLGELGHDDHADMPVETMTPENISYWQTHNWIALPLFGYGPQAFKTRAEAENYFKDIAASHVDTGFRHWT